jgi:predicted patatin/cPLA2 family phospholipase
MFSEHFINLKNIFSLSKNAVDIQYISDVWRGKIGNKKIDIDRIRENSTKMLIAMTEYETGKQVLFDAKTLDDPVDCLQASASIPVLYKGKVIVDKTRYVDGSYSEPLPIEATIKSEKPTSILIFANRSKVLSDNFLRKLFTKISGIALPFPLQKAIRDEPKNFEKQLRILRQSKIPYTIIWTDDNVDTVEKDRAKIVKGAKDFETYLLQFA